MTEEEKDNLLYAHSGCCNAHWEVVYNKKTKEFFLACEQCGKGTEEFKVTGPEYEDPPECECCKQESIDETIDTMFTEEDEDEDG